MIHTCRIQKIKTCYNVIHSTLVCPVYCDERQVIKNPDKPEFDRGQAYFAA